MIHTFKGFTLGDKVKLSDGDGRHHIIKKFEIDYSIKTGEPFAVVIFEDNASTGFIYPDGISDLIKI